MIHPSFILDPTILTRDTLAVLVLSEARVAAAPSGMVLRLTVRVDTARQRVARVNTLTVDTGELARALGVCRTLHLWLSDTCEQTEG